MTPENKGLAISATSTLGLSMLVTVGAGHGVAPFGLDLRFAYYKSPKGGGKTLNLVQAK
jgi:hypothetical protein